MRTQSPAASGSSSSRPTFTTRLTPSTLTIARSSRSARTSTISPGMPRHMRHPYIERILRYRFTSDAFWTAAATATAVTTSPITSRTLFILSSLALVEQVADQVDDRLCGPVDDRRHLVREPDPLVDGPRFAADHQHPADGVGHADATSQAVERREQGCGVHAVRVERRSAVDGPVQVVFEQVERARLVSLADGVDEDERGVAVEQAVGQVHPTDADVRDLDPGRPLPRREPARHLDAEPVVGEEDVADARDQNSRPGKDPVHAGSISSGWK